MIARFIVAAIRMNAYPDILRHAIWTAPQAQHMPSATEEIFCKEIPRDFNIRWN